MYKKLILKWMNYFLNDIGKYVFEKDSFTFNRVSSR